MTQKNKQIQQISEIRKSFKSVIQIKARAGKIKVETEGGRRNNIYHNTFKAAQ